MFDEEGRKINLGMQVGMKLDGMSVEDLNQDIGQLKLEIEELKNA